MIKYFDSHCHLNMDELKQDFDNIYLEMKKFEFGANVVGFDLESSIIAVKQTSYENIYATIGVHPCDINNHLDETRKKLEALVQNNDKVVAIGETGFDFYHEKKSHELYKQQLQWLDMHFMLAKKYDKALMLHVRDGHDEMIEWVKNNQYDKTIIHCFNQNYEVAKKYLDYGCYLSIPGVVTFKNALDLQQALVDIPANKILIETDAPFLTPVPYRGKKNVPQYAIEVYKKIAEIKKIEVKELAKIVLENNQRIFKLKNEK